MAAITLVKDVLYQVSVQLHDINPQFNRWTSRELVSWLNDGQRAIAKYVPTSCSRVDAVKLQPGTKQNIDSVTSASIVPGDGSSAVNVQGNALQSVIRNMGVNGQTPGKAIRITDRETLDVNDPNWHTVWVLVDSGKDWVDPVRYGINFRRSRVELDGDTLVITALGQQHRDSESQDRAASVVKRRDIVLFRSTNELLGECGFFLNEEIGKLLTHHF